jgi:hypothetical protein
MIEGDLLTKKQFSELVTSKVQEGRGDISYIDAIVDICERRGIDPEDTAKLIDSRILGAVQAEATKLNMIEGFTTASLEDLIE